MRVAQFVVFVLLLSSQVTAQNEAYAEVKPAATAIPSSIEPGSLPATPKPQKVIDKKFFFIMGTLGLAESMRITTTTLVLDREADEGAPWVTSRPSHPHLVAKNAAIYAAEMLVAYEIKKPHAWLPGDKIIRKLWWMYPAAMAGIHFKNAAHNINLQPPAGCDAPECQ